MPWIVCRYYVHNAYNGIVHSHCSSDTKDRCKVLLEKNTFLAGKLRYKYCQWSYEQLRKWHNCRNATESNSETG